MKKVIVASIALSLLASMNAVKAEDNRTEERVGFGTGMVIGAIAGGPPAAIIAAVAGAWLGDKVNEADKVPELETALNDKQMTLSKLKQDLQVAEQQMDEARLLLQDQQATARKVSHQMNAVSGLKMDILFRTNSSELDELSIDKLVPVALMMEQFNDFDIQLTGHGDTLGSVEANQLVAEDRALRVRQSLVNAGIESSRIHIVSLGKSEAQAALEDIDGRAVDRRVRIQFVESAQTSKPTLAQN